MTATLWDILKKGGLIVLVYGALVLLGNSLNALLNYNSFLVSIFSAVKVAISPFDYWLAVDTLIIDLGLAFSIIIAFWTMRASVGVYKLLSK